jgi:hypothetical protein
LRRLARGIRGAIPFVHRIASRIEGNELDLPYMQMNAYEVKEVERHFVEATGSRPRWIQRVDDAMEGVLFIGQRPIP